MALTGRSAERPRLMDTQTILEKKEKLDTLVEKAKQQILELKDIIVSGAASNLCTV